MKLIQNQWQPKKIEVDISQFSINTMHADHLYEGVAFSSAAGIVRGANPMPSHLLSVRLSGINLFSNQIDSLTFHVIYPIFGLNVHNNIAPKLVELEFLFFWFWFLNGFFITKKKVKIGTFEGLGHFLKSFWYGTMKLGSQAYCGDFQVCVKNGLCGPNFRAFFGPK